MGISRYLVPSGLLPLFRRYGKRALYNNQLSLQALIKADEPGISELLEIIKREHKGLEQEIFNDLFSEELISVHNILYACFSDLLFYLPKDLYNRDKKKISAMIRLSQSFLLSLPTK